MIVRIVGAAAGPGGRAMLLCDDAGEPLPNQRSNTLTQPDPGSPAEITVTFIIDGAAVRFEE